MTCLQNKHIQAACRICCEAAFVEANSYMCAGQFVSCVSEVNWNLPFEYPIIHFGCVFVPLIRIHNCKEE